MNKLFYLSLIFLLNVYTASAASKDVCKEYKGKSFGYDILEASIINSIASFRVGAKNFDYRVPFKILHNDAKSDFKERIAIFCQYNSKNEINSNDLMTLIYESENTNSEFYKNDLEEKNVKVSLFYERMSPAMSPFKQCLTLNTRDSTKNLILRKYEDLENQRKNKSYGNPLLEKTFTQNELLTIGKDFGNYKSCMMKFPNPKLGSSYPMNIKRIWKEKKFDMIFQIKFGFTDATSKCIYEKSTKADLDWIEGFFIDFHNVCQIDLNAENVCEFKVENLKTINTIVPIQDFMDKFYINIQKCQ